MLKAAFAAIGDKAALATRVDMLTDEAVIRSAINKNGGDNQ